MDEPVKTFDDAPALCIDPEASYTATFVTSMGDIVVDLDTAEVPGTVNNFVTLARYGYYDDTLIFRADPSIDIIQGGGLTNSDSPGYNIPDEADGFTYEAGQLVMARTAQPDSAGGQWFFVGGPNAAALDAQGTYVVFGDVTEGLDIVQAIIASVTGNGPPAGGDPGRDRDDHRGRRRRDCRDDRDDRLISPRAARRARWAAPTSSHPSARRTIAEPVGSSTTGVVASDSVRCRRSSLSSSASGMTASPWTRPRPSVNAPPRWSSIGSHSAAALAPTAATTPPPSSTSPSAAKTAVPLSALRRCCEESPTRYTARARRTTSAAPASSASWRCSTINASITDVEALAPRHRRGDQLGRLLEGVGGRQHDDARRRHGRQQPPVEVVVGDERSTAEEGHRAAHRLHGTHGRWAGSAS